MAVPEFYPPFRNGGNKFPEPTISSKEISIAHNLKRWRVSFQRAKFLPGKPLTHGLGNL